MLRFALAFGAGLAFVVPAPAGTWAEGMFEELVRDFGVVPRGPTLTHSFKLTNNTQQTAQVTSVRVSCGCVSATVMSGTLQPGQSTVVLAQMDSRRFTGAKTVTIYVQFSQPEFQEVRLTVSAYGRDDIAVQPENIAFGAVARGSAPSKTASIAFTGQSMRLVSVSAESNYVQLAAREVTGNAGEYRYEVTAKLRPDTPVGKWYTDVWLNTSNPASPRIRVPLSVDVEPALNLSPGSLALGTLKAGEKVERRVIVRGAQPFRITEVQGTDDAVQAVQAAAPGTEAKPVHVLIVTVKPGDAGDLSRTLKIVTDLTGDSVAELPVKATVTPAAKTE